MLRRVSSSRLLGLHLLAAAPMRAATLAAFAWSKPVLSASPSQLPLSLVASRRTLMAAGGSLEEQIKETIASNKVVVYSKSYCPFCTKTKGLFNDLQVDFKLIELDEMEGGSELQQALTTFSGQRTVPNVFINGEHVGGNDDTMGAYRSGKLQEMLK